MLFLQLPRHKAVVVRLNASDDSDSEIEASSSAQCVFGGLESMIKEARRTVEVRGEPTAVHICTALLHYLTVLTCFFFSFPWDDPGGETEACPCGREREQPSKNSGHFV